MLLRPEVFGRADAADLTIHRLFEQDRGEHPVTVEGGRGHDPCPHGVHQVEHLVVVRPGVLLDAVELERLGGTAAALVERCDESLTGPDLVEHVVVHTSDCSQQPREEAREAPDW